MASKPPAQPKADPATISSEPGEMARKQQELRNRRKGGFYSDFSNIKPNSTTGGGNQTLG